MRASSMGLLAVSVLAGTVAVVGTRAYVNANTRVVVAAPEEDALPQIVIASEDINFGDPIDAAKLKLVDWPAGTVPEGAFDSITDLTKDDPRHARQPIAAGEPVLFARVTQPGIKPTLSSVLDGDWRAVTIRADDVLGVAGLVSPGDSVDVMLTRATSRLQASEAAVDVLLENVEVLAIDQDSQGRGRAEKGDLKSVTLKVRPDMAQKLALASNVGTLSLALRGQDETDGEASASGRKRLTLSSLLGLEEDTEGTPQVTPEPDTENPLLGTLTGTADRPANPQPAMGAALPGLNSYGLGNFLDVQDEAQVQEVVAPTTRNIEIYNGMTRTLHEVEVLPKVATASVSDTLLTQPAPTVGPQSAPVVPTTDGLPLETAAPARQVAPGIVGPGPQPAPQRQATPQPAEQTAGEDSGGGAIPDALRRPAEGPGLLSALTPLLREVQRTVGNELPVETETNGGASAPAAAPQGANLGALLAPLVGNGATDGSAQPAAGAADAADEPAAETADEGTPSRIPAPQDTGATAGAFDQDTFREQLNRLRQQSAGATGGDAQVDEPL